MPGNSRKCVVPSCYANNRILKRFGVTLRYFGLPKDKKLRNEWLSRCKMNTKGLVKNSAVCSRHFRRSDYEDGVVSKIANARPKRLKPDAIPSLFLDESPQELLEEDVFEYHRILAQEILGEESDLPIYLEFSGQSMSKESPSPNSVVEADYSQHSIQHADDSLEVTDIDIKEEPIIQHYVVCNENKDNLMDAMKRNMNKIVAKAADKIVGNCYVCDRAIKQHDLDQLSREDFSRIVQKVLEDIGTEFVIVMKEEDGLCGMCRSLVARITKLETELRTTSLGLRALLRLKYSLPPPDSEKREESKVQIIFQKSNSKNSKSGVAMAPKAKDSATQTIIQPVVDHLNSRHKMTQTIIPCKNKKVQTVSRKIVDEPDLQVVYSLNEIESLEKGDTQEENNVENVECMVQYMVPSADLFEDISAAEELTTLLSDNCLAEECQVVTETTMTSEQTETEEVVRRPTKTRSNLGLLKCARCNYKTKSPEAMKKHMLSFINEEDYYCSICDFAYHISDWYKKHSTHHSPVSKNKRCAFCDEVIHDQLHMRFHIEAKHRPTPFSYRCELCGRVFMFADQLRRHKRLKHKLRPSYQCDKCDKKFGDKIKFDSHVEFQHRESLNCKYCSKPQANISRLISHENTMHRLERKVSYQCRYCPRRFIRQDMLPKHENRHTGVFPYRCDTCGYGFYEAASLQKHSWCKVYKFGSYKATWMRNWPAMVKHRLRKFSREPGHNSRVCDVCGKIISTRPKYRIHREMHDSPAGQYQCHVCGKKFRYKDNMSVHIRNLHPDAE